MQDIFHIAANLATLVALSAHLNTSIPSVNIPAAAITARAMQAGQTRTLKSNPPFPNTSKHEEILANVAFGIRQMRLDEEPGREAIRNALQSKLVARRILDVQSQASDSDYYVVELIDSQNRPLADVLIAKSGVIWSVWQFRPGVPRHLAPDLDDVTSRLTRHFGKPMTVKYYHALNNIEVAGGSWYVPLVLASTPSGRVFVNSKLELFLEEKFEKHETSAADEVKAISTKRAGQLWVLEKGGVGTLKRIGDLKNVQ